MTFENSLPCGLSFRSRFILIDGGALRIPTIDHVYVTPAGNRVFVSFDDGTYDVIRPLMIGRVMVDREASSPEA